MGDLVVSVIVVAVIVGMYCLGGSMERTEVKHDCEQMKIFRVDGKAFTCQEVTK